MRRLLEACKPAFNRVARWSPASIYFGLALTIGLCLCFVTPPGMVPDESGHFLRAFEVSEGGLISTKFNDRITGAMLPKSLEKSVLAVMGSMPFNPNNKFKFETLHTWLNTPLHADDRAMTRIPQALYNPLVYFPAAIGIRVARIFADSPILLLWAGRVATCLATVLLLTAAIAVAPVHRYVLAALAFMPSVLFQGASVSADAVTFGLCFLFIAVCWRYTADVQARFDKKSAALLILTAVGACLAKQAYFLLLLLLPLIPCRFYGGSMRKKWLATGLIAGIGLAAPAAWTTAVLPIRIPARFDILVDAKAQLAFVVADPWRFLVTVWNTVRANEQFYLDTTVGRSLSWWDLILPSHFIAAVWRNIIFFALFDGIATIRISWVDKTVQLLIAASLLVFIEFAQYLSWNPVGSGYIDGPVGRYFVPFVPLIFFVLYNSRVGPKVQAQRWLAPVLLLHCLYVGVLLLRFEIVRFYGL